MDVPKGKFCNAARSDSILTHRCHGLRTGIALRARLRSAESAEPPRGRIRATRRPIYHGRGALPRTLVRVGKKRSRGKERNHRFPFQPRAVSGIVLSLHRQERRRTRRSPMYLCRNRDGPRFGRRVRQSLFREKRIERRRHPRKPRPAVFRASRRGHRGDSHPKESRILWRAARAPI